MRLLPSKINIDNWSHQLALIWCYCCDNKHFRTLICLYAAQWCLSSLRSPDVSDREDPWGISGVPAKCDVLLWTLHSSLAVKGVLHWAKGGKGKHLPQCGAASSAAGSCRVTRGVLGGGLKEGLFLAAGASCPLAHCFRVVLITSASQDVQGCCPGGSQEVFEVLHTIRELISLVGTVAHLPWAHRLKING